MLKPKLSFFIDGVFIFFITFFISYAFSKPIIKSIALTTSSAIFFSSIVTVTIILLLQKLEGKRTLSKTDQVNFELFLNYLYLQDDKTVKDLIFKHYSTLYNHVEITENGVLIKDKNAKIFFDFTPEKTPLKTIINAYKNTPKNYVTVFISKELDDNAVKFFSGMEKRVVLYSSKDFYVSLKSSNNLPKLSISPNKKQNIFKLIVSSLKRENAKKFLIWGGVLTIISTFTFYGYLYLFLGISFLIIATVLRFFTKKSCVKQNGIDLI